jgi:hypothetical protein
MIVRFLVFFTALILIGTVLIAEVAKTGQYNTPPLDALVGGLTAEETRELALLNKLEGGELTPEEIQELAALTALAAQVEIVGSFGGVRVEPVGIEEKITWVVERNTAIMERNSELIEHYKRTAYKYMLFSILGMWSLVLGLRWAITGKWRLWGKKE